MNGYAKCAMCGKVHMGLLMAWHDETGDHLGHVCYSCEDRVCQLIAAGKSTIRWLTTWK